MSACLTLSVKTKPMCTSVSVVALPASRFEDAGYYYWLLAKLCLDTGKKELQGTNEDGGVPRHVTLAVGGSAYVSISLPPPSVDPQGSSLVVEEQVEQFRHFLHLAEVYHVYHNVHRFVVSPDLGVGSLKPHSQASQGTS